MVVLGEVVVKGGFEFALALVLKIGMAVVEGEIVAFAMVGGAVVVVWHLKGALWVLALVLTVTVGREVVLMVRMRLVAVV